MLPSGEVLGPAWARCRSGQAWHVYKRSLGPSLDALFMQSNFGIVTKMGVWLMPYPESYMQLRVWNQDDLHALVETLRVLAADKTIEQRRSRNTIAFASIATRARTGTRATSRSRTRSSIRWRARWRSGAG